MRNPLSEPDSPSCRFTARPQRSTFRSIVFASCKSLLVPDSSCIVFNEGHCGSSLEFDQLCSHTGEAIMEEWGGGSDKMRKDRAGGASQAEGVMLESLEVCSMI